MSEGHALVAFVKARLDEKEQTIYREGSPPNGVIAWLTYCRPDGSMGYTTVAHGDNAGGPWIADGKELPEPASVLVVHDPVRGLREVAAQQALIARYERAVAVPESAVGFVRGQDSGYAEACLDAIRDAAAAWSDHPDYREEWQAVGEAVVDEQGEGSMEEFVAYLVDDMGYSRNECPDHCPVKADEHAHLHSPGNPASIGLPPVDFILWADGTATRSDSTRGPDCISEVDKL